MNIDIAADLFDLERVLDFHQQRHGVLAANIANANTPNYRALDLVQDKPTAIKPVVTHRGHMPANGGGTGHLEESGDATRADGGGVEIEQAMAQVTANRLRYNTGIELTRRRLAILRYAATDGSNA